eukprot:scaffold73_cov195-Alexandrium_tamarense.AAC.5
MDVGDGWIRCLGTESATVDALWEVVSCNADVVDETASVLVDHVVNLQRNFQEFYRESVGVYKLKVPLLRALSSASKEKEPSGPSVLPSVLPCPSSVLITLDHGVRSFTPTRGLVPTRRCSIHRKCMHKKTIAVHHNCPPFIL